MEDAFQGNLHPNLHDSSPYIPSGSFQVSQAGTRPMTIPSSDLERVPWDDTFIEYFQGQLNFPSESHLPDPSFPWQNGATSSTDGYSPFMESSGLVMAPVSYSALPYADAGGAELANGLWRHTEIDAQASFRTPIVNYDSESYPGTHYLTPDISVPPTINHSAGGWDIPVPPSIPNWDPNSYLRPVEPSVRLPSQTAPPTKPQSRNVRGRPNSTSSGRGRGVEKSRRPGTSRSRSRTPRPVNVASFAIDPAECTVERTMASILRASVPILGWH